MRAFISKCPKCANKQKILIEGTPHYKKHKCVYCGKSYTVHKTPSDTTIIKEVGVNDAP